MLKNLNMMFLKKAFAISKESSLYYTLNKAHRKEAVLYTYRLLLSINKK